MVESVNFASMKSNPAKSLALTAAALVALSAPVVASAASSAADDTATSSKRPNVILLVADDLGYGDMSCYGAHRVNTPRVDSIASQGVRFTNAHACASTSTPSRYSLLTGEYCFRKPNTNIADGDAALIIPADTYTVADMMHDAGYRTAAIGKWHLGLGSEGGKQDWNKPLDVTPADIGFDHHYIMAATADRVPCVFFEDGQVANYDPSAPIEVSYRKNFPGEPTGKDNPELLTKLHPSHGHDMSIVNGISRIGYMKGGGKALWRDEDIADSIASHAIDFMAGAVADGEPFFVYLCTNDVHVPRYPHERFRGLSPMGLRGEAIMQFDYTVGLIDDALDSLGIADNTMLIITSDNGPVVDDGYRDGAPGLLGDHRPGGPWRGGKYGSFEAGTAVPMIVRWPGVTPEGKVSDALVSQIDNFAVLAEIAGAETHPAGAAPDSKPYVQTWTGRSDESRDYAVAMAADRSLTLRTPRWKYIAPGRDKRAVEPNTGIELGHDYAPALFDMNESRFEENNVISSNPDVAEQMRTILENL